jgi:hypothetical protein
MDHCVAAARRGHQRIGDAIVQLLTGHAAGTVKAALGIGKAPTRDCRVLSKLEKVMVKHLDNKFSTIAIDLEAQKMAKKPGLGGSKRAHAEANPGGEDEDCGKQNETGRKKGRYHYSNSTSQYIMSFLGCYRNMNSGARARLAAQILKDLHARDAILRCENWLGAQHSDLAATNVGRLMAADTHFLGSHCCTGTEPFALGESV